MLEGLLARTSGSWDLGYLPHGLRLLCGGYCPTGVEQPSASAPVASVAAASCGLAGLAGGTALPTTP